MSNRNDTQRIDETDPKERIDAQTERLPGDIHFHLKELRTSRNWSMEKAAKEFNVSLSKYKRMENAQDQPIDDSLILRICDTYGVSSDYLLGRTTVAFPAWPFIEDMGLSQKSVKRLMGKRIDWELLNRIIEHRGFTYLMWYLKNFVNEWTTSGISFSNEIYAGTILAADEVKKTNPEKTDEITEDQYFIKSLMENHPDEAALDHIHKTLDRLLLAVRQDIRKERNTPVLMTRNEIRDLALSVLYRRQNGEKYSFLRFMKGIILHIFRKVPLFGIREGDKENEIVVSLPSDPERLMENYASVKDSLAEVINS